MTSWHALPFELKAQILADHISTTLSEYHYPYDYIGRRWEPDTLTLSTQLLTFLQSVPELKNEAIRCVERMLKQLLLRRTTLEKDVKTIHERMEAVEEIEVSLRDWAHCYQLKGWWLTVAKQVEVLERAVESPRA